MITDSLRSLMDSEFIINSSRPIQEVKPQEIVKEHLPLVDTQEIERLNNIIKEEAADKQRLKTQVEQLSARMDELAMKMVSVNQEQLLSSLKVDNAEGMEKLKAETMQTNQKAIDEFKAEMDSLIAQTLFTIKDETDKTKNNIADLLKEFDALKIESRTNLRTAADQEFFKVEMNDITQSILNAKESITALQKNTITEERFDRLEKFVATVTSSVNTMKKEIDDQTKESINQLRQDTIKWIKEVVRPEIRNAVQESLQNQQAGGVSKEDVDKSIKEILEPRLVQMEQIINTFLETTAGKLN